MRAPSPPIPVADASPETDGWTDSSVSVRLVRGAGGVVRAEGRLCSAPLWARWDGATLWLVGSGASPVGDDHVRLEVEVGPGVRAVVRSVAATVVYAAVGPGTRWDTDVSVAEGAVLDWRPEPVIVTERARHAAATTVRAAAGARVILDEVLVLGRSGEQAGSIRSSLSVHVDGDQLLLTGIDTSLPGWTGPAGTDGRSVVAHRLEVAADGGSSVQGGPTGDGAVLEPAPGCRLAVATAVDVIEARRQVDIMMPT